MQEPKLQEGTYSTLIEKRELQSLCRQYALAHRLHGQSPDKQPCAMLVSPRRQTRADALP